MQKSQLEQVQRFRAPDAVKTSSISARFIRRTESHSGEEAYPSPRSNSSNLKIYHHAYKCTPARAELSFLPVIPWEGPPPPGGGAINCHFLPRCVDVSADD